MEYPRWDNRCLFIGSLLKLDVKHFEHGFHAFGYRAVNCHWQYHVFLSRGERSVNATMRLCGHRGVEQKTKPPHDAGEDRRMFTYRHVPTLVDVNIDGGRNSFVT
jgi:hypothetical protein